MRTIDSYPDINPFNDVGDDARVIAWFSGGVASAVACALALKKYKNVVVAFCDTGVESPDTYRFMKDFETKFGVEIIRLKSDRFNNPEEVWRKYGGMNFATGAPCSTMLKKEPRIKFQRLQTDFAQVFGFDYDNKEMKRARNMLINNPDLNPIFPLIVEKLDREAIFQTVRDWGITPPEAYKVFKNNNCIAAFDSPIGGCVQGGIGYWQLIKEKFPLKYETMANIEHEISKVKGKPVTICKDQRKGRNGNRLFLKHNPDYPEIETIDVIKGKQPVAMQECNGFCSTEEHP